MFLCECSNLAAVLQLALKISIECKTTPTKTKVNSFLVSEIERNIAKFEHMSFIIVATAAAAANP